MALMCSTSMVVSLVCRALREGRDSDRNASSSAGDVLGPVVVQHVAGRRDDVPLDVGDEVRAARGIRPWCSGRPTRCETSVRSPSTQSTGAVIRFQHSSHSSTLRAGAGSIRLWFGSASRSPCGRRRRRPATGFDQCAASQAARSARSSGLVLRSRAATASSESYGRSCSASSARRATGARRFGACCRLRARHAEAFEVDEPAHARRAARRRRASRRCRPCCGRAGRPAPRRRRTARRARVSRSPR